MPLIYPDRRWTNTGLVDTTAHAPDDVETIDLSPQLEAAIADARHELADACDEAGIGANPVTVLALAQLLARNAQAHGLPLSTLRAAVTRFYVEAWRDTLPSPQKH